MNEKAKRLIKSFIPGNKSVWVFPSENPDTHADRRNFYRRYISPRSRQVPEWRILAQLAAYLRVSVRMSGATEWTLATLLRHSGKVLVRRYAQLSVALAG